LWSRWSIARILGSSMQNCGRFRNCRWNEKAIRTIYLTDHYHSWILCCCLHYATRCFERLCTLIGFWLSLLHYFWLVALETIVLNEMNLSKWFFMIMRRQVRFDDAILQFSL
jgi:hypothetical protein